MKTSPEPTAITVFDSATFTDPDPVQLWSATIVATPETALLARILQKASVPELEIHYVRFESDRRTALTMIRFSARPARARAVAAQWEKLIRVQRVAFEPTCSS